MINKIKSLNNINTFWDDVRQIVGYYEGKELSDAMLTKLTIAAEEREKELTKEIKSNG